MDRLNPTIAELTQAIEQEVDEVESFLFRRAQARS
jgi:hypothetical protein